MPRVETLRTRQDFLSAPDVLLILRDVPVAGPTIKGQPAAVVSDPSEGVEILLSIWGDGDVIALNGHVDLGTGIRTALAQIVAEELDVPMARVAMILGDTALAPNQGATIASASIQIHAAPLKAAAAQARAWLIERAAERLGVAVENLDVRDGVVHTLNATSISYADLVRGEHVSLKLHHGATFKPHADYRVVGTSTPRVDIPAKVAGDLVFVHDMRMPGMLHGRVIRPPYAGADHGDFIGNTLESVDESSIAHIPGVRAVVVIRDFVGVVADREEHAEQAAAQLRVTWKPWPHLPQTDDVEAALSANPSTSRRLVDEGDVEGAIRDAAESMPRTYLWPYQMHASIGPSCAVAHWHADEERQPRLTVWAGTQNPHVLRSELALLAAIDATCIEVIRMEAAGCYGRNGADDVAADASLLSRAVGAPVRVQLTREQENLWEPKGAAQWMTVRGGLAADREVAAYDFATSYPSNGAPTLALLLTRTIEPHAQAFEMGDRTARPPYDFGNLRVTVNDMAPILRASWLRGVSALPNSFAHESYIDELATAAHADPLAFRLKHLHDPRATALLQATADKAGWIAHTEPQQQVGDGDVVHGQGVAYARYVHSAWPGFGASWSAWVADVDVDRKTGEVHVRRVVVGQDSGLMINPAGIEHQMRGNVIQTTSRALKEQVRTDATTHAVAAREWGSYPILSFREVPVIEVLTMARPDEPPLGAGESASVPGTAAIANAIFDATGVRFRQPPFTPEVVRAALNPLPGPASTNARVDAQFDAAVPMQRVNEQPRGRARFARRAVAIGIGVVGFTAAMLGLRSTIAPITRLDPSIYTAATIERGRQLAATGNCVGCHTAHEGTPYAGGLAIETPFGAVYGTNLTPDVETGIGAWSFSAFQRAMREGVSRDGHHLYPAFPYTAFTRTSDDDLNALYAYLMSQPAVRNQVPKTALAFPFNLRSLMAMWNGLFHTAGATTTIDATRTAQWNRGAYLVDGLGHCGACHTSRNALGAESDRAYLAGAMVDGWEAPALASLAQSPVPWTEDAFYRYLRTGHSDEHGAATGPMAPVIRELAAAPDDDLRAMAHYLASLSSTQAVKIDARAVIATARANAELPGPQQRMFESACGACHHDGDGPKLLGVNVPLALTTKLHGDRPDNLLRVILDGVREPATREIGFMPAFRDALDDRQIAKLAVWMRRRYAPSRAPWTDLDQAVARVRATRDVTTEVATAAPKR
jgi:nicotinate dehydrogenase subunit B